MMCAAQNLGFQMADFGSLTEHHADEHDSGGIYVYGHRHVFVPDKGKLKGFIPPIFRFRSWMHTETQEPRTPEMIAGFVAR